MDVTTPSPLAGDISIDKDISKLLEEVPRATSAPPHLADRWPTGPDPASLNRGWPGIEHADIRFDEDYARFYEAYSGQRKLPPPVEGRTLYSELGLLQQKQHMLAHQGMLGSVTPPPTQALLMGGGLTPGGLEVIQEQGPSNGLVQAFQHLGVRGSSPAPRLGNGDLAALAQLGSNPLGSNPLGSKPGTPFEGGRGEHKQRGGKSSKESRDGRGSGPGGRREREKDNANHDEGIAHFSARFLNLEEVSGQLMSIAQDQNGCRFLQRKFDESGAAAIAVVFKELLEHATELMMDPFGNYLVQKLLDRCSEEQRLEVLKCVCEKGQIVEVALNTHGTRAVQKLIETLTSREQRALVISALGPGVVSLIKDLNGNHVVQRCLQRLGPDDSQFVYDAAQKHCMEVATHRHGCCVLQRCIDFATPQQKTELVLEIAGHALQLSQDAFGNYVVQYVLELGQVESSRAIMKHLVDHYAELSMQKFSSNVVEKCLKLGGLDPERQVIIREILSSPLLPRLLQDSYGNYVVQSALAVSNGDLHQDLVDAIKPFLPSLRGTPHGKRILQKINGKV
eukprot:gene10966-11121_t